MKSFIRLKQGLVVASLSLGLGWGASAQPTLKRLTPTAAPAGTPVTVSGSGFAPVPTQNAVYFGLARATVTAATSGQLTVLVPAGAASVAPVTVTNLSSHQLASSLTSGTPFFTVVFAGPGLNASSYQATSYPLATSRVGLSSLATADLNADNYPDFAVVADGQLRLLLSDGQGGYLAPLTLPAGSSPTYVRAADVDANGAPDLLIVGNGLLLYRNLGNGNGFATATSLNLAGALVGGTAYFNLEVQDLDGDGLPDLLLPTTGSGPNGTSFQLVTLHNNGPGFDPPVTQLSQFGQGRVADFTGDGKPDIVAIASSLGQAVKLLLLARKADNTGYETPVEFALPAGVAAGAPFQLADFNSDGRPDLAVGTQTPTGFGIIELLRTTTDFQALGPFSPGSTLSPGNGQVAGVADLDGNGLPDVLVAGAGGTFTVLRGQAGGGLAQPLSYGPVAGGSLVTGDFDRDGRPADVASFDPTSGDLTIFRYTGASPGGNPPTLNPLADLALPINAPAQTVGLSGISNGGQPGQPVTITAVSSDPSLVPNPTITYFSPTTTGTLRLQPASNAFGTCLITVTVANGQAQNGTFSRSFRVTVNPGNAAPTLDAIPDVVITNVVPASGNVQLTIPLSGITAGLGQASQILTLSSVFTWNDPAIFGGFSSSFTYTSPAPTGQYQLAFGLPAGGPRLVATVMITVSNGLPVNTTFTRTFRIFYNPGGTGPNLPTSPPTLDPLADVTANRGLPAPAPVTLTGIGDGDPNQVLPLTVTATSSDPDLVSVGPLSYSSPAATGSLAYSISATRGGAALVSVTVSNGQPQNGSLTRSFRVTVPAPGTVVTSTRPPSGLEFSIFPNPAMGGRFYLRNSAPNPLVLVVFDLCGREIRRWNLPANSSSPPLSLPMGTAPGLYLVRGQSQQGSVTQRLTVE